MVGVSSRLLAVGTPTPWGNAVRTLRELGIGGGGVSGRTVSTVVGVARSSSLTLRFFGCFASRVSDVMPPSMFSRPFRSLSGPGGGFPPVWVIAGRF